MVGVRRKRYADAVIKAIESSPRCFIWGAAELIRAINLNLSSYDTINEHSLRSCLKEQRKYLVFGSIHKNDARYLFVDMRKISGETEIFKYFFDNLDGLNHGWMEKK